ncbi:MAG TPA: hypothetical protein VGD56_05760 [Gemmatirosa sp.]
MHEVHHGGGHGKSPGALALELLMIGVGVFLGLQVDQWKENRAHREAARASLENFRAEIATNRKRVATVAPYHAALSDSALVVMHSRDSTWDEVTRQLGFQGTRTVVFAHTAWDLALATQALSFIEPKLAFSIAQVYDGQRELDDLGRAFTAGSFTPQTFALRNPIPFVIALNAFATDVKIREPVLIARYDSLITRIDAALGRAE